MAFNSTVQTTFSVQNVILTIKSSGRRLAKQGVASNEFSAKTKDGQCAGCKGKACVSLCLHYEGRSEDVIPPLFTTTMFYKMSTYLTFSLCPEPVKEPALHLLPTLILPRYLSKRDFAALYWITTTQNRFIVNILKPLDRNYSHDTPKEVFKDVTDTVHTPRCRSLDPHGPTVHTCCGHSLAST